MGLGLVNLVRVFGRIGLLSFGGPAAQIALMHIELVDPPQVAGQNDSFSAPCPLHVAARPRGDATGHLRGLAAARGARRLIAGLLFVLPGALVILGLALGYASYGQMPVVQAAFRRDQGGGGRDRASGAPLARAPRAVGMG